MLHQQRNISDGVTLIFRLISTKKYERNGMHIQKNNVFDTFKTAKECQPCHFIQLFKTDDKWWHCIQRYVINKYWMSCIMDAERIFRNHIKIVRILLLLFVWRKIRIFGTYDWIIYWPALLRFLTYVRFQLPHIHTIW